MKQYKKTKIKYLSKVACLVLVDVELQMPFVHYTKRKNGVVLYHAYSPRCAEFLQVVQRSTRFFVFLFFLFSSSCLLLTIPPTLKMSPKFVIEAISIDEIIIEANDTVAIYCEGLISELDRFPFYNNIFNDKVNGTELFIPF